MTTNTNSRFQIKKDFIYLDGLEFRTSDYKVKEVKELFIPTSVGQQFTGDTNLHGRLTPALNVITALRDACSQIQKKHGASTEIMYGSDDYSSFLVFYRTPTSREQELLDGFLEREQRRHDRLSKRTMDRQLKSDQEALRRLQDRYGADFQSKLSLDQRTKRSPK